MPTAEEANAINQAWNAAQAAGIPYSPPKTAQQDAIDEYAKYQAAFSQPRNDLDFAHSANYDAIVAQYNAQKQYSIGSSGLTYQPTGGPQMFRFENPTNAAQIAYNVAIEGGNIGKDLIAKSQAWGFNPEPYVNIPVRAPVATSQTIPQYDRVGNPLNSAAAQEQALHEAQNPYGRAGFTNPNTLGDIQTQRALGMIEQFRQPLGMTGVPVPSQTALTGTILSSQLDAARATPGVRDDQFFNNELQKWGQNFVEKSSAYHHEAARSGLPVPSNPFEYQGDLAVEFLKGAPNPERPSEWFSPVSGVMGARLPGGVGLQGAAWETAKTLAPGPSFGSAVQFLNAAEGKYGPYGALWGGPDYVQTEHNAPQFPGMPTAQGELMGLPAPFRSTIPQGRIAGEGMVGSVATTTPIAAQIPTAQIPPQRALAPENSTLFGQLWGSLMSPYAEAGAGQAAGAMGSQPTIGGRPYVTPTPVMIPTAQPEARIRGERTLASIAETSDIAGGVPEGLPAPFKSTSTVPGNQTDIIGNLSNMWDTKSILPESQRIYLPPPSEIFGSGGKSRFGDIVTSIAGVIYGIPYGQVKGAEVVRAQEAYEKSPIYKQYSNALSDYETANTELQSALAANKDYVHLDPTSGKYIISPETPKTVADGLMSKFDEVNAKSQSVSDLSSKVENYEYNSPFNRLQRETSASFGNQKPFELFGTQPTLAWKTGVDALTYGLVGGNTGVLSGVTSKTATNPAESVLYGVLDFPVMTLKAAADAPLGIEMAARDIINRGSGGISTVAGYGQAQFGKYIVDDPLRAVTMLATGHIMGSVASETKQVVMQKTGLTRMSSYEVTGSEVVANAPATRTIADVMNKDTVDVTHSSPAPIRGGFAQISRQTAGDVAHGNTPAPGVFGAPIVKDIAGRTLFEPTSNFLLNKPLLWPAVVNTARAAYNLADATIHQTGYTSTISAAKAAGRGYANTIIKYIPIVGGSREYIIRNVQTLAPEFRSQHAAMAAEIRRQLETQGYIEPSLYDAYTQLAYEKSAATGGAPVAIIAPKKASGYHLGMKEAMGAPFESEVYMVSAREIAGVVTPSNMIRITSRDFKGYAYGPTGAKVVEVGIEGMSRTPRSNIATILRENAAYNRNTFNSYYSPYPTLFSLNVGGSKIQRGWYDAAVQDAVLKAHEMYGEPGYWAPKGYYGQHGYEHSVAVAENVRNIISRSPETEARLGGAASADRYANAMGLSHDIAKIGEAESQPYTHAFIAAEAMRTGQLQTSLGTTTYNRIFQGMSRADIIETSKAVSEHTQIQPMRAPGLREAMSHPSSVLQPVLGLVSEAIWRPGAAGRTLATADRLDIGRVGMPVRESKLFRTPEEQREANVRTATNAAIVGGAALSVKMGLPPVVAGVMLSETMFGTKRGIQKYEPGIKPEGPGVYISSEYKTTIVGYTPRYQKYQPEYQTTDYEKRYSEYNKGYRKYGTEYNPSYESKYSEYSPSYNKQYGGYEKGYSQYRSKYEPKYIQSYSKYEPGYKAGYEKGYSIYNPTYIPEYEPYPPPYTPPDYTPYKPYEEQPPPPYIGVPYGSIPPGGGGQRGEKRKRRRKVELFSFEMAEDTPIPMRYGLGGATTEYVPGIRGIASGILRPSDYAHNRLFQI